MSFSLQNFGLTEMLRCGRELGRAAMGSPTLEAAAQRVVRYLYENAVDPETGDPECALVRFFITQPYRALDDELQAQACGLLGCPPGVDTMNCLVLLGTAGEEADWNDRRLSRGHQAIPLPDESRVAQVPMIAELFRSLGVDAGALVQRGDELLRGGPEGKMYRVFFIPEAKGSPYIPAQTGFVEPYGIRSVLGWGGMLHAGELFAVVVFAKVPIPAESADRFRHVALDVKAALSLIPAAFGPPPAAEAVG